MTPEAAMPHHHAALAILLAAAAAALTGCTLSPTTTATPSTAGSSPTTPTPDSATPAIPPSAAVAPATSEAAAIRDANATVVGYYQASFQNGHAGGTRLELVMPWVTGAARENERALATYLQRQHYRLDGAPTGWNLNPSRSSATQTKAAGGSTNPFGSARLVGCATSTNYPVGEGAPAWTTNGQQFARAWTVLYNSSQQRWLVAAAVELSDAESKAVACP